MAGSRGLTLWAIGQLHRLDGVVAAALGSARVRLFSLGYRHDDGSLETVFVVSL